MNALQKEPAKLSLRAAVNVYCHHCIYAPIRKEHGKNSLQDVLLKVVKYIVFGLLQKEEGNEVKKETPYHSSSVKETLWRIH